jgi:hypothetical protein
MAWFYNLIFDPFLRIGLVASLQHHPGPAATMVPKSTFFLRNSQISKIHPRQNREKDHFSMACSSANFWLVFGKRRDNLACTGTVHAFNFSSPPAYLHKITLDAGNS